MNTARLEEQINNMKIDEVKHQYIIPAELLTNIKDLHKELTQPKLYSRCDYNEFYKRYYTVTKFYRTIRDNKSFKELDKIATKDGAEKVDSVTFKHTFTLGKLGSIMEEESKLPKKYWTNNIYEKTLLTLSTFDCYYELSKLFDMESNIKFMIGVYYNW